LEVIWGELYPLTESSIGWAAGRFPPMSSFPIPVNEVVGFKGLEGIVGREGADEYVGITFLIESLYGTNLNLLVGKSLLRVAICSTASSNMYLSLLSIFNIN